MALAEKTPGLFFPWSCFIDVLCEIKFKKSNEVAQICHNTAVHLCIHVIISFSNQPPCESCTGLLTLMAHRRTRTHTRTHTHTHSCIAAEQGHARKCCAVCPNCDSYRANKSSELISHTHMRTHTHMCTHRGTYTQIYTYLGNRGNPVQENMHPTLYSQQTETQRDTTLLK